VGCDDIPMAAMATPPLTTIAMPTETAGRTAIDLLLRRLQAGAPPVLGRRALATQLLVRSSTMPPPGGTHASLRRTSASAPPEGN